MLLFFLSPLWSIPTEGSLFDMVLIEQGSYSVGSSKQTHSRHRTVALRKGFYIMATEVTKELWFSVTAQRRGMFHDCTHLCPVQEVSWFRAVEFANELSMYMNLKSCYAINDESIHWDRTCTGYRLPTEDEWEIAAYDGTAYAGSNAVQDVSWNLFNANRKIHKTASKDPNKKGLYDMSGNVWEWVWDGRGPISDKVSRKSRQRIRKGGSWSSGPNASEVFFRGYFDTQIQNPSVGLRLVRTKRN